VVSTPLKHINQLGLLFPIYGKIKKYSKPPTSISFCDSFGAKAPKKENLQVQGDHQGFKPSSLDH